MSLQTTSARGPAATRLLTAGTCARIVLAPVVMALILVDGTDADLAAAALFAFAAATDYWDGWLARRWGITTTLGSFLDTTADKLLVAGVLIALVEVNRVSTWIAAVIIGRELVILGLRGAVAVDGALITPSIWGKLKAGIQFVAIVLAILRPGEPLGGTLYLDQYVMLAAAIITVLSAVDYLQKFSSALRD